MALVAEKCRRIAGRFWYLSLCLILLVGNLPAQAAQTPVDQSFIHDPIFNARVRLLQAGPPHGPVIVLVHGLNASADVWQSFIPSLSRYFHVVAFDLPGFGKSSKANRLYSPDNYVAFMHNLFGKLQVKRFILVGHSMGGNIALRYAMNYPQEVRRLVLIDAAGILHRLVYTEFLTHFGIRILPQFYPNQRHDLTALTASLFEELADYSPVMDIGEHYMLSQPDLRQQFLDGAPPAIAAYAMAMTNFSHVLDYFSIPTLLLWGGQDHVAPLRIAHILAANFDNAGLIVIPDSGHSPLHDAQDTVTHWLLRFTTAGPGERDQLLAAHRYQLPIRRDAESNRIGRCRNLNRQAFHGDYRQIIIDHCSDVLLQGVRARQVTIIDSTVSITRCRLRSEGATLFVKQSAVTITACRIDGLPAIEVSGSKLDIAGSHLRSSGQAIRTGKLGPISTILFSISALHSDSRTHLEHGPLRLFPGQGL